MVRNDLFIDINRVAGEANRIGFRDDHPLCFRDFLLYQPVRISIESSRVIQQPSFLKRAKARVQVIKARINQAK